MNKYKLIIFDMDGTLADRDTAELLPNVREKLHSLKDIIRFSIATNQGGVGLRMQMESQGWGEPAKYPTEDKVLEHIDKVQEALGLRGIPVFKCYRYQNKKGEWSPYTGELSSNWSKINRKPNAGMLIDSMIYWDALPEETLMVGDSPEDEEAAKRAGCDFMWAWDFFEREKPE